MTTFAVIEDTLVINTIVADSKEIAEQVTDKICIEYTDNVGIGDTYVDGVFIKKVVPEPTE